MKRSYHDSQLPGYFFLATLLIFLSFTTAQSQTITFNGDAVHVWQVDEDPLDEYFTSESLEGVSIYIENISASDDCSTSSGGGSSCGDYSCTLDYNTMTANNLIGAHAIFSAGWFPPSNYGTTILDLLAIEYHNEDTDPFYCMTQYVAADMNGDGFVNETDEYSLQTILLGNTREDLVNPWSFFWAIPYGQTPDFIESFWDSEPSPESYNYLWDEYPGAFTQYVGDALVPAHVQHGFMSSGTYQPVTWLGIKIGDVNFSYSDPASCLSPGDSLEIINEISHSDSSVITSRSYYGAEIKLQIDDRSFSFSIIRLYIPPDIRGFQLYLKTDETLNELEFIGSDLSIQFIKLLI